MAAVPEFPRETRKKTRTVTSVQVKIRMFRTKLAGQAELSTAANCRLSSEIRYTSLLV